MQHFHFDVYDGVTDLDRADVERAGWLEARLVAIQRAGANLRDDPGRLALGEDWRMEVTDHQGLILFRLDVSGLAAPLLSAGRA